ncbi:MAG: PqqD family protein [Alphaproteobacteria bacterium]|nr:PqqD family protein [Alphaproteobacteria bacterium]
MSDYRPGPDVVCTPLADGSASLLHLPTMTCFELNGTGLAIWEGVQAGRSSAEIAAGLAEAHDLGVAEAADVVAEFAADLVAEGLIVPA